MTRPIVLAALMASLALSGCQVFAPPAAEGAAPTAAPLFVAPSAAGVEPAGTGRTRGTGGAVSW